ncbi:MAG: hypothetical protein ACTS4W_00475 [Candidatus Hodgkinia cicadicola]
MKHLSTSEINRSMSFHKTFKTSTLQNVSGFNYQKSILFTFASNRRESLIISIWANFRSNVIICLVLQSRSDQSLTSAIASLLLSVKIRVVIVSEVISN